MSTIRNHVQLIVNVGQEPTIVIEENGIKKFYPIEKESEVDERRNSIGLKSLKVYANKNSVDYYK